MAEPIVLEILVALPEQYADFGLSERVTLPPELLEQIAAAPDVAAYAQMVGHALQGQFQQAAWSLATSLTAVLAQRAADVAGPPLTSEVYIAHQEQLLEQRRAAAAAAQQDLQSSLAHTPFAHNSDGTPPDAPQA